MSESEKPIVTNQCEDEKLLISRAREGDDGAFEQIVTKHQWRIITLAHRLLGDRDEATDAGQEVFLKLYRNLAQIDPEQNLSGWLYKVTVNTCRDLARSRRRRAHLSLDAALESQTISEPIGTEDTESHALLHQQQVMIGRALATLTERERVAIVLRDLEGLSSDEVAAILGSSATTVRSQISSGRKKLRTFREQWLKRRVVKP